ncbi:MAG TPA: hypothetical protein DCX52_17665 [Massilia sp.]|nr:hypothetical protein [Massilia sp.]
MFSLLTITCAGAQEISEAGYVGAMEGAALACAAAFPHQARDYQDVTHRLVACHMSEGAYRNWHARLRAHPHYAPALEQGRRSLDPHPGNRERQCRSLKELACGPGTKPAPEQGSQ